MQIRDLVEADVDQLVVLNGASVPAVSPADAAKASKLLALSSLALAVVDDADPLTLHAFALLMSPGVDYRSENYRWFEQRGSNSLYVDRIVVADGYRDRGIGTQLYRAIFDAAHAQGRAEVTCEVNVVPPNPGSMRFHTRLGFVEVGRQWTKGDTIEVALLAAALSPDRGLLD